MSKKSLWHEDHWNDRLVAYLPEITSKDMSRLADEKNDRKFGKIIIYTSKDYKDRLKELGYSHEANMSGFFNGEKAFIYSFFADENRSNPLNETKRNDILNIVAKNEARPAEEWKDIIFEKPSEEELVPLAELYTKIFNVYPTDIFDPEYLKKAIETDYLFVIAKEGNRIAGAASAMKTGYGSAEITDCAVAPEYRGRNILHGLIVQLEKELKKEGICHAFSITRAMSTGMNMTVKRLSYIYEGTVVNNCKISSGYEDMNIWTKKLSDCS